MLENFIFTLNSSKVYNLINMGYVSIDIYLKSKINQK